MTEVSFVAVSNGTDISTSASGTSRTKQSTQAVSFSKVGFGAGKYAFELPAGGIVTLSGVYVYNGIFWSAELAATDIVTNRVYYDAANTLFLSLTLVWWWSLGWAMCGAK